ncbi:NUDIX hydrolase [Dokdonella koreensis]|uniref:Phosphatase NudJ n=1 Tax=Dokdonella koreensis DS-123 TaxID=1300342 RepID=A0A160DUD7_9GAMM|nr:NUDIX hydrolase [Dokdonella koreensis]ANB17670.1 7,8-dihydro-8-oxoguanine-triphosphatase [Dokdonella koreensis DS-123]
MNIDATGNLASADDIDVWRPHVTVATVVQRAGRFLLVEEDIRGEIVLNQPAGHLDPDESLLDAAIRETLEETGWDVALTAFLGVQQWTRGGNDRQFVRFVFAAEPLRHHADRALDTGIVQTLWLSREEIAAAGDRLRSPMVLASVEDWLAGPRLPLDAIRYLTAAAG